MTKFLALAFKNMKLLLFTVGHFIKAENIRWFVYLINNLGTVGR